MTPMVSVIISTYNRKLKLKRAVESVLNQTFKDIEVIVVDNASVDGTEAFMKGIQDSRVSYIRHETNKGGPAARNTGIKNGKASLIALLDDDDEWFNTKLIKQVEKIKQVSDKVGLVYVGSEIFDERLQKSLQTNKPEYRGNVYQKLLLSTILSSVSSVLIKKDCFDKVGLFDEALTSCQDWDMWLRIAKDYEFDYVDEILVRINMHGEQISTDYSKLIPGRTRMVQKHAEEFKKYPDIYVNHLKRVGKLHCLNGTWIQAMPWFRQALRINSLEIFKIGAWIILEWPRAIIFSKVKNFKKHSVV